MLFVETVGLTAGERHGRPRTVHATIPVRVQFTGQLQPARRRSHQLTFMFRLHTHLFTLQMAGQHPLLHLTDLPVAFRLADGQALFDQGGHLLLACLGVFGTHLDQFLVLHFAGDDVPGGFVGGKLRHVARVRRQPVTRLPVDPLFIPIGVFDHQVVLDAVQMITLLPFQLAFERIVHHTGSIPVGSIGGADRPVRFRLVVRLGRMPAAPGALACTVLAMLSMLALPVAVLQRVRHGPGPGAVHRGHRDRTAGGAGGQGTTGGHGHTARLAHPLAHGGPDDAKRAETQRVAHMQHPDAQPPQPKHARQRQHQAAHTHHHDRRRRVAVAVDDAQRHHDGVHQDARDRQVQAQHGGGGDHAQHAGHRLRQGFAPPVGAYRPHDQREPQPGGAQARQRDRQQAKQAEAHTPDEHVHQTAQGEDEPAAHIGPLRAAVLLVDGGDGLDGVLQLAGVRVRAGRPLPCGVRVRQIELLDHRTQRTVIGVVQIADAGAVGLHLLITRPVLDGLRAFSKQPVVLLVRLTHPFGAVDHFPRVGEQAEIGDDGHDRAQRFARLDRGHELLLFGRGEPRAR